MRDFSKFGADNQAESKGYGFVNFTSHEHALRALRSSNNNPKIFNPKKVMSSLTLNRVISELCF